MALGFQDCCNSSSYFLLTGIPASVQEFETYYIQTLQGETFCAKYVELPKLNYSLPIYTLVTMTEKTSCSTCDDTNPCPPTQEIFLSQFGTGTVATSTDCYIKTIFPMVVNCNVDPPTSELTSDGTLGLYIIGGVAPYVAYEAGTHLTDNPTVYDVIPSSSPNTYTVRENLPEGTYSLTVTDSQGNFFVDVSCTLDAPPAPATVNCSGVPPSTSFEDDGSITINVAGGIPPYSIQTTAGTVLNTLQQDGSITINNLTSGNYSYVIVETAQGSFQANQTTINCTVPAGVNVTYPTNLCLSMLLCSQTGNQNTFYLTLIQQGTYNNRPVYVLSSYSANIIGNPSGFKIRWGGDNVGWTSVAGTASGQPQFATPSSCSSSNYSFSLTSSYTAGGTIPLTALPQNFTWDKGSGYLTNLNATNISLSSNACPVNVFVSVSDSTICQNNVNSDATIILTANGGSGEPYSFFYRKGTTGSYTGPVTSPIITIASSQTAAGDYQVYSVDGSGTQSTTQTFTITNLCLSLTVTPSPPNICPNWEDQQGVVTFTLTSSNSNSTGPYIFYWRKQSSPALQWNVISSNNLTQTVTVYGSANSDNAASSAGNNGYGTYEFYVESTNGDNSGVVYSTLNNIPCTPVVQPLTFSKTVTLASCTNSNVSIELNFAGGTPPYTLYYQILPLSVAGDGLTIESLLDNNWCSPYQNTCNTYWNSFPITEINLNPNQTQHTVTVDTFNEYLLPSAVGPFVLNLNSVSQSLTTINNQAIYSSLAFKENTMNVWQPDTDTFAGPPVIIFWYKDSTDTYFPNNPYPNGFNNNSIPNFALENLLGLWGYDNLINQSCFLSPPPHISVITQMSVATCNYPYLTYNCGYSDNVTDQYLNQGIYQYEPQCTSLQPPNNVVDYSSQDTGQCYNWTYPLKMQIGIIAPYPNIYGGIWDSVSNQGITTPTILKGWFEIKVKRQYIYSLGYNASLNASSYYLLLGGNDLQDATFNECFWPTDYNYVQGTPYKPIINDGFQFIFSFPNTDGTTDSSGGIPTTWPVNKIGGGVFPTDYVNYPIIGSTSFVDSYTTYKTNYKKTTSSTADASTTNPAATVNANFMPSSNYSSCFNLYNSSCSQLSQLYYGYNSIGNTVYTPGAISNPFAGAQSDGINYVNNLLSVSVSCVNSGCADGATVNGCPVVWTADGKKFVANYAGTLSTESVFTIGSQNEPLTLKIIDNGGPSQYRNSHQAGSLTISFQWQGQHTHIDMATSPLQNNCQLSWGQGVQIETIFHPTSQIKCIQQTLTPPTGGAYVNPSGYYGQYTNQDIPIRYYYKKNQGQACSDSSSIGSCNVINDSLTYYFGKFYFDFTDQTSYGASIQSNKIIGNQNQYPDPFNFGNEKIID